MDAKKLAKFIDHSALKPWQEKEGIIKACHEALEYGFYEIMIQPNYIKLAREIVNGSDVKVGTVVSFPHGNDLPEVKAFAAVIAVKYGADEIDMVMNLAAFKSKEYELVKNDIRGVVQASVGRPVKVIIETSCLADAEKELACKIVMETGAAYVKTSTGFTDKGAVVEDVKLMRRVVGDSMGVKASGGIRTLKDAISMIEAGANRLGVSAGVSIVKEIS